MARGLAAFGKVSSVLFSHLLLMSVSAVEDAPVAAATATQGDTKGSRARRGADTSARDARDGAAGGGGGLPVVVFCHGLGGTRHLYSQMYGQALQSHQSHLAFAPLSSPASSSPVHATYYDAL